ncbi:MAG: hypothetical protein ACI9CF_000548 [Candidatus Omnitrophota bacterium]|jgi:hypothetical protein
MSLKNRYRKMSMLTSHSEERGASRHHEERSDGSWAMNKEPMLRTDRDCEVLVDPQTKSFVCEIATSLLRTPRNDDRSLLRTPRNDDRSLLRTRNDGLKHCHIVSFSDDGLGI